ncbi:MAG: ABC transporter ATP-binding protein [Kineosporiaceae bacterium]
MTRIDLEQVTRRYPGVSPALDSVDLTVAPGCLVTLLGASGSGKSTLLKVVAGIERPDAGRVLLGGRDVTGVPAHRRGAVLMFQRAHLFPYLSVAENVAFGLRVRGERRSRTRAEVDRMLDLVGLPGAGPRRPGQLSGGEQQRVALARALVTRPRVLLLDEPFSNLDPRVRGALQEAVRGIQQELGITAVLVTHDRAEAMAMADRVALLAGGRLLACDDPRAVFERPPTVRAARLMGVATFLPGPDGALLAIRPEHVGLASAPAPDTRPGTVVSRTFRGEHTDVVVGMVGGGEATARWTGPAPPAAGEAVHVRLPADRVFPVVDDVAPGSGPADDR